jgi:hypothetical protein
MTQFIAGRLMQKKKRKMTVDVLLATMRVAVAVAHGEVFINNIHLGGPFCCPSRIGTAKREMMESSKL